MTMPPQEFNERRLRAQECLLIDMEVAIEQYRETRSSMVEIEKDIIKKFKETLKDGNITAYKSITAHAKLTEAIHRGNAYVMALYDRVSGVTGIFNPAITSEEEAADGVIDGLDPTMDDEIRLEAERVLIDLVNYKRDKIQQTKESAQ